MRHISRQKIMNQGNSTDRTDDDKEVDKGQNNALVHFYYNISLNPDSTCQTSN